MVWLENMRSPQLWVAWMWAGTHYRKNLPPKSSSRSTLKVRTKLRVKFKLERRLYKEILLEQKTANL